MSSLEELFEKLAGHGQAAQEHHALRALTGQYNAKINTPIQSCSECPHCKKIKREETLKAMDISQHLLDKKAKYEKRCEDWVEKIRKLAEMKA